MIGYDPRKCVIFGCQEKATMLLTQPYLSGPDGKHRLCSKCAARWNKERPETTVEPYEWLTAMIDARNQGGKENDGQRAN